VDAEIRRLEDRRAFFGEAVRNRERFERYMAGADLALAASEGR